MGVITRDGVTSRSQAIDHQVIDYNDGLPARYSLGFILLLFIASNFTLFGAWQLRIMGIIMLCSYTLILLICKWSTSPQIEIRFYFFWVVWAALSYTINANQRINPTLFIEDFKIVLQVMVMTFVIAGIVYRLHDLRISFLGFLIGGLILLISSAITGELQTGFDPSEKFRTTGLTANANYFAYLLVLATAACLFFWSKKPSKVRRTILMICMTFFALGIISSGSRKAFLGFIVLIFAWLWMCYRRELLRKPSIFVGVLIILCTMSFTADFILSNTFMGTRFKEDFMEQKKRIEDHDRAIMYQDGWQMIQKNPVFGVGLGNYQVYSTAQLKSHSDYIEVAAGTGVVGFLIYFSIYGLLWRRLTMQQQFIKNKNILYNLGILKATMVTVLVLAFGRENYSSQITWVFLGSAIGYASWLEDKMDELSVQRASQ